MVAILRSLMRHKVRLLETREGILEMRVLKGNRVRGGGYILIAKKSSFLRINTRFEKVEIETVKTSVAYYPGKQVFLRSR